MASVRLVGIAKRYGGREALEDLSLDVADGEFFVLLGPPGAGKTTLLRLIAGLEAPDAGEIYLGQEQVNKVPAFARDVAMVFEDLALYPHLTGYENLAYPLRLRRMPAAQIAVTVRQVAEMLHIAHLLDRRPDTYSGGEKRRVAVGRALVRRPRLLLMDQPFTDLDAKIRQGMTGELKRLQRETSQTILYATHDYEEAVGMANRILVMKEGRAEQLAAPQALYDRPETAYVASLVGSPAINLFPCQLEFQGGRWVIAHPAFHLALAFSGWRGEGRGEVLLGIRPEDVQPDDGPASTVRAQVDIIQPLGEEQIVDLKLPDGTNLKAVWPLDRRLRPDMIVGLIFPAQALMIFDAHSGKRLGASA